MLSLSKSPDIHILALLSCQYVVSQLYNNRELFYLGGYSYGPTYKESALQKIRERE